MLQWLALLHPLSVAVALILVCGLPIAWGLRSNGYAVLIITVPASFAVIAATSIVAPFLKLTWWWPVPVVASIAIGAVLRFISRFVTQRRPSSKSQMSFVSNLIPFAAVIFAGGLTAYTLAKALPGPDAISQTYDAIFHLNATQLIIEHGNASPLAMDLSAPGNPSFYPTVWHATVSLVAQITDVGIPLATNAVLFTCVSLVWGVGAVGLGRTVAGPGRNATLAAGVFAAAFPSLPLSLTGFGVLYPNLLSMSLLPYVIISVAKLSDTGRARATDKISLFATILLLAGSLGAAALAHPNALHASFILTIGFVFAYCIRSFTNNFSWYSRALGVAVLLTCLLAGAAFWFLGRTGSNDWSGAQGPFGAIIEAFGTAPHLDGHNWVVSCFMLTGIAMIWVRRSLAPFFISFILALSFYVLADGFPPNPVRELFLSPWYSDPWRLAAIVPLAMLPFAVLGGKLILDLLRPVTFRFFSSFISIKNPVWWYTATVAIFGVAITGTSLYGVSRYIEEQYATSKTEAPLLSLDERVLLERLENFVSDDDVILANPWNGSSLAYALSGRQVAVPHAGGNYPPEIWEAYDGITSATPPACEAAERIGARFVLDFGKQYVFEISNAREELDEISDIIGSPALTAVDSEGDAVLYKITGCSWKE